MEKYYKHILIPLDGSELAESALKDGAAIAAMSMAKITLLSVIQPIEDVINIDRSHSIFIDEQANIKQQQAYSYLHSIAERIRDEKTAVHTTVEIGNAGEVIIDYASSHDIDLIVMATHGRSGLKRWVYGSVAEKVLRGALQPVLLVRSYSRTKRSW